MLLSFAVLSGLLLGASCFDWSTLSCGEPPSLSGGYIGTLHTYSRGGKAFKYVAKYACYGGVTPTGKNALTCELPGRSWRGQKPSCGEEEVETVEVAPNKDLPPCARYSLAKTHSLCLSYSANMKSLAPATASHIKEILDRHKYYRSNVDPPAKRMPTLKWDKDLALSALKWAARCSTGNKNERSLPDRGSNGPAFSWVGQNTYMASGFQPSWKDSIDSWGAEKSDWKYGVGPITGKESVGHYTQMIWAETTHVGCGHAKCHGTWEHVFVCQYGPGGNSAPEGKSPYTNPYESANQPRLPPSAPHKPRKPSKPKEVTRPKNDIRGGLYGPRCRPGVRRGHSSCKGDSGGLIKLDKVRVKEVLDRHNYWRRRVSPRAKNMPMLKYDDDLAITAERWAAQCKFGHDSSKARKLPHKGWDWVGQNAYAHSADGSFTDAIDSWAKERHDWRYGVGRIRGVVGHYTQVVWDKTLYVGCGKAVCRTGWRTVVVCNYGPGGNFGHNPYRRPYAT